MRRTFESSPFFKLVGKLWDRSIVVILVFEKPGKELTVSACDYTVRSGR
jgi:hypothetical protein